MGLLRLEQAEEFVRAIANPITQSAVDLALREVIRCVDSREEVPNADFDLLFFVISVEALFEKRELVNKVLHGYEIEKEWE